MKYIFGGEPYCFREMPGAYQLLRKHLAGRLSVAENDIVVVGSGKTGFSLSPDNFGRGFSPRSDVDVLIVSSQLFDVIWKAIIEWHYPFRFSALGETDLRWSSRRRWNVYWGWFYPSGIPFRGVSFPGVLRPIRDISTTWFNAFRSLSTYKEFASRNYQGRLYRTWEHALLYHRYSLREVMSTLR